MAQQKKGLGKGLSALIPDGDMDFLTQVARGLDITQAADSAASKTKAARIRVARFDAPGPATVSEKEPTVPNGSPPAIEVDIQWIDLLDVQPNPFQPRRNFRQQDLEELADSVRLHGVLQPVLVRPNAGDTGPRYQLVAGERRWRAAQLAGLATVPAIVRAVGDQQALELAIIENVQRHDISPLDAATAYRRLSQEFGLSQDQLATRVGKSRSAVANTIRLLELTEEAQRAIEDGRISEGHGRALLQAPTQESQRAILHRALRDGLSVRDVEQLARHAASREQGGGANGRGAVPALDPEVVHLEKKLEKALGSPVRVKVQGSGGHIVVEYFNLDDLDRLINLFVGK